MKFKVKFPCGYELETKSGTFGDYMIRGLPDECPLHGKDCPPMELKIKKKHDNRK